MLGRPHTLGADRRCARAVGKAICGATAVWSLDDASTDGTTELLRDTLAKQVHHVLHDRNQGKKSTALRKGFGIASGDVVIVQDADMEYDPKEIPLLLEPILQNQADVVFGSRFMGGNAASMKLGYSTMTGLTSKARRSAGKMAFAPSGRSANIICGIVLQ